MAKCGQLLKAVETLKSKDLPLFVTISHLYENFQIFDPKKEMFLAPKICESIRICPNPQSLTQK